MEAANKRPDGQKQLSRIFRNRRYTVRSGLAVLCGVMSVICLDSNLCDSCSERARFKSTYYTGLT
jgi:hypothetical protein